MPVSDTSEISGPNWEIRWIDSAPELEKMCRTLASREIVSLDTETVGWDTGNEQLCLIQIGIPDIKQVAVLDALSIKDLSPLKPVLSEPHPKLVAHNATFEIRQFERHGIKLSGLIDTLEWARELRPDLPNHTLQTCCRFLLNLKISKEEQTSDWSLRPLRESQLRYAALDAEVTMNIYYVLAEMKAQLKIPLDVSVPKLMEELAGTVKKRVQLTKEIAAELALCHARENMLREAIKARLISGEPAYQGEFGRCHVAQIKRTEVSPKLVREKFSSIAELVIGEYVERKRLISIMKEHGIDERRLDEVLEVTGYTDRLYLSLADLF